MPGNVTTAIEPAGTLQANYTRVPETSVSLCLLDTGKMVMRALLVPVAFSLACAGLFIFGLIAKYADERR